MSESKKEGLKTSTVMKGGCLAVMAVPLYLAGVAAYDVGRTAFKYPRSTILALAATTMLWYNCPALKERAAEVPKQTIEFVQQYRQEKAEERKENLQLAEIVTQYQQLEQQHNTAIAHNTQLEQVINERKAYDSTLESRIEERVAQRLIEEQSRQKAAQQTQEGGIQRAHDPQTPQQAQQTTGIYAQATHYPPPPQQHQPPSPAREERHITVKRRQVSMTQDSEFHYYFVDVDETLEGIGRRISSNPDAAVIIARDNGITDPRQLMAGQELRIREHLYNKTSGKMWDGKLDVRSTVLKGDVRISEAFADPEYVISLNRELGVNLQDGFKYPHGKRIVHY